MTKSNPAPYSKQSALSKPFLVDIGEMVKLVNISIISYIP